MTLAIDLLCDNAEKSFWKCIRDDDNAFLKSELNVPVDDITPVKHEIKIVFSESSAQTYTVVVVLLLVAESKEVGKYSYIENHSGEFIDDIMVFY